MPENADQNNSEYAQFNAEHGTFVEGSLSINLTKICKKTGVKFRRQVPFNAFQATLRMPFRKIDVDHPVTLCSAEFLFRILQ